MLNLICVNDLGSCSSVEAFQTDDVLKMKGDDTVLNPHFCDNINGLIVFAKCTVDEPWDSPLLFNLPPPLNTYVLPSPIFLARFENDNIHTMTLNDLKRIVSIMRDNHALSETTDVVYDVNPVAEAVEMVESDIEDDEDEEEEGEEDKDSCEEEEDDDWDDEEVAVPIENL